MAMSNIKCNILYKWLWSLDSTLDLIYEYIYIISCGDKHSIKMYILTSIQSTEIWRKSAETKFY
jgi:hypothetical protein